MFTSSNWNRPQTVTVHAPHDADAGDGEGGMIIHTAWGDSPGYDYGALKEEDLPVTVDDDETARLMFSKRSLRVPSGGTDSIEVWLATPPSPGGAVELTASASEDSAEYLAYTEQFRRFDAGNWDTPQTIEVPPRRDPGTSAGGRA